MVGPARRRWAVAVAVLGVASCGEGPEPHGASDAAGSGSDARREVVVHAAVLLYDATPEGLVFTVNGESGEPSPSGHVRWQWSFPSYAEALEIDFVFEARFEGAVLDRLVAARCVPGCDPPLGQNVISEVTDVCGYPTGELRFASVSCDFDHGVCVGDGFCQPRCNPWGSTACGDSAKCARVLTHVDPTFGVLDCVPDGHVPVGGACSLGAVGRDTGYDDCEAAAVCVEGFCVPMCDPTGQCPDGLTCEALPGLLADYGACR